MRPLNSLPVLIVCFSELQKATSLILTGFGYGNGQVHTHFWNANSMKEGSQFVQKGFSVDDVVRMADFMPDGQGNVGTYIKGPCTGITSIVMLINWRSS